MTELTGLDLERQRIAEGLPKLRQELDEFKVSVLEKWVAGATYKAAAAPKSAEYGRQIVSRALRKLKYIEAEEARQRRREEARAAKIARLGQDIPRWPVEEMTSNQNTLMVLKARGFDIVGDLLPVSAFRLRLISCHKEFDCLLTGKDWWRREIRRGVVCLDELLASLDGYGLSVRADAEDDDLNLPGDVRDYHAQILKGSWYETCDAPILIRHVVETPAADFDLRPQDLDGVRRALGRHGLSLKGEKVYTAQRQAREQVKRLTKERETLMRRIASIDERIKRARAIARQPVLERISEGEDA